MRIRMLQYNIMREIKNLKINKKLFAKIKIQNFESEALHTNIFKINCNILTKVYFCVLLTLHAIGHTIE